MKLIILSSISINSGSGIRIFNLGKVLSYNNDVVLTGVGKNHENAGKLKYVRVPRFGFRFLTHLMTFFVNCFVVLSKRADFVIASKTLPTSCLPAILGKKILGRKIILDIDDLEHGYWKGRKFEGMLKFFEKVFPKFFDRITTHTKGLKEYIKRDLNVSDKKIIFLPQGIDCGMFEGLEGGIGKGKEKKKIVLYAAHLGPAAKLDHILRVLKDLTVKGKDLMLVVVGGGEYLSHYKNLVKSMGIENYVMFTGFVDHKDVPGYLAISDVAVNYLEPNLANKYRSSIKVREYLAAGVPVVCNVVSEDLEQFSKYLNSFKTGDLEEMGKQILKAIEKPDMRKVKNGKGFVKKLDWNIIGEGFEEELSKI